MIPILYKKCDILPKSQIHQNCMYIDMHFGNFTDINRTNKNYQAIESLKYYFFLTKGNISVYPAISVNRSIINTKATTINNSPRKPPAGS